MPAAGQKGKLTKAVCPQPKVSLSLLVDMCQFVSAFISRAQTSLNRCHERWQVAVLHRGMGDRLQAVVLGHLHFLQVGPSACSICGKVILTLHAEHLPMARGKKHHSQGACRLCTQMLCCSMLQAMSESLCCFCICLLMIAPADTVTHVRVCIGRANACLLAWYDMHSSQFIGSTNTGILMAGMDFGLNNHTMSGHCLCPCLGIVRLADPASSFIYDNQSDVGCTGVGILSKLFGCDFVGTAANSFVDSPICS